MRPRFALIEVRLKVFFALMLLSSFSLSADDSAALEPAASLPATQLAKEWQPPNTRGAHILGGGDRIAYMRLKVKASLEEIWNFYASKAGYSKDVDFSKQDGIILDPAYIIIGDQKRNLILLIHNTEEYCVTVRIPKQEGDLIEDILVTIGTREPAK